MNLFNKYQPTCWEEVVGHARVKMRLRRMVNSQEIGGRAFIFTGPSGVGKSSLARLLAYEVCDPDNVLELDATKVSTGVIDELDRKQRQLLLGAKSGRVNVINEVHKLDSRVIGRLLTLLERIPENCTWVFTTQGVRHSQKGLFDDDDSSALESRCTVFPLEGEKYVKLFAQKARQIAIKEGLENGQDLVAYVRLAADCDFNLRRMLSRLDAGEFLPEEIIEVLEGQSLQFT